jgi:hypothetical protein
MTGKRAKMTSTVFRGVVSIWIASAVLAGCGNSVPPSSVLALPHAASTAAKTQHLYILWNWFGNGPTINEYPIAAHRRNQWLCFDPLPPYVTRAALGVNAAHTLYVPLGQLGTLTFGPNCGAQGPTLIDPGGAPNAVAFDNNTGTVYVSDGHKNCVEVYEHGATSPTRALCNSAVEASTGVAVDAEGNVFESTLYFVCCHVWGRIVIFPHGRQKGSHVLPLEYIPAPCCIIFDRKGNLLVVACSSSSGVCWVNIYAPPFKGPAYRAIGKTVFGNIALDSENRHLYVGDGCKVDVYTYPAGTYEYSIGKNTQRPVNCSAGGVAADPPGS